MKGELKRFSIIPLLVLLTSTVLVTQTKDLERLIKKDVLSQETDIVPIAFVGFPVYQVVIDPKNPAVVYAGVMGKGLYKSLDYGGSWALLCECHLCNYDSFIQILVDPTNSNTLYWNKSYTILKSTDGGISWFEVYKGHVGILAFDPKNTAVLYAGVYDGVLKSIDGGNTWQKILTIQKYGDVCYYAYDFSIVGLLIDPYNTDTIYFFYYWYCYHDASPNDYYERISKSVDGGFHWSEIFSSNPDLSPKPPKYLYFTSRPVMNPCDSSVIYAGVQNGFGASYDGGNSWFKIADKPSSNFTIHPSDCRKLYASSDGLCTSNDNGCNWQYLGLNNRSIFQIAIDPQFEEKPERIYIATDNGIYGIGPFHPVPWTEINIMEPKNHVILSGTVTIKARIISTDKLKQIEFFVDDQKIGEANPSDLSEDIYTCDWDTRQYGIDTYHLVKVKAINEQGDACEDRGWCTCYVQNVKLMGKAGVIQEHSWLIRKWFVNLSVNTENPYHAAIDRYILYRNLCYGYSAYPCNWRELKTYNATDVLNGTLTWYEPLFNGLRYWYRVEARDAQGTLLAVVKSDSRF